MENIDKKAIAEAVKAAQDLSVTADSSLQEKTFEVVLSHLLERIAPVRTADGRTVKTTEKNPPETGIPVNGINFARIATQLDISEEQAEQLYELKNGLLSLGVKPIGAKISDKQRSLARALLIGYRLGLDRKEVSISELSKGAEEWNILNNNFGRNINDSYVQMKGLSRGKRPSVSLAPGAIEALRGEIAALLGIHG